MSILERLGAFDVDFAVSNHIVGHIYLQFNILLLLSVYEDGGRQSESYELLDNRVMCLYDGMGGD